MEKIDNAITRIQELNSELLTILEGYKLKRITKSQFRNESSHIVANIKYLCSDIIYSKSEQPNN